MRQTIDRLMCWGDYERDRRTDVRGDGSETDD